LLKAIICGERAVEGWQTLDGVNNPF
jgi:hypothetical protein